MNEYAFCYVPVTGTFTRLIAYIKANNLENARLKFYLKYGEESLGIISVERIW